MGHRDEPDDRDAPKALDDPPEDGAGSDPQLNLDARPDLAHKVDLDELFARPGEDEDSPGPHVRRQSFKLVAATPSPGAARSSGPPAGADQPLGPTATSAPTSPTSDVLALSVDTARVDVVTDEDGDARAHLELIVDNTLGKVLELEELIVVFRDVAGALLAVQREYFGTRFSRDQELITDLTLGQGVIPRAATVELLVAYELEFQTLVASALLEQPTFGGELPHRLPLPLFVRQAPPVPGFPRYEAELAAFDVYEWDGSLQVLVHLRELGESEDDQRDGVLALRDKQGQIIAREELSFARTSARAGDFAEVRFDIEPSAYPTLARLDLALSGTVGRRERLGVFELVTPN